MGITSFKLQGSGLSRVFGELEAPIMDAAWQLGTCTIQDVCDALGPQHNYKTVMTVMNRLVTKRFLSRQRVSKAFAYSPVQAKDQFMDSVSRSIVGGLIQDFGAAAITQFVDVLDEVAPEQLRLLEHLIQQKSTASGVSSGGPI